MLACGLACSREESGDPVGWRGRSAIPACVGVGDGLPPTTLLKLLANIGAEVTRGRESFYRRRGGRVEEDV